MEVLIESLLIEGSVALLGAEVAVFYEGESPSGHVGQEDCNLEAINNLKSDK